LQTDAGIGKFMDHPSIANLRATRCRQLVLVDDFIGSGQRATGFVDAFYNNKSVRSWRSYGRIRISVVAYAGTCRGIRRVEKHPVVDRVLCGSVTGYGSSTWDPDQTEAVERLCRKYADRTRKQTLALGFKRVFSVLVFEHKCPNTVPVILWQRSRNWTPLFREAPQRGLSSWPNADEKAEIERAKQVLAALNQTRLSTSDWDKYVSLEGRKRLLVLAAIGRGLRKVEVVSQFAEVSIAMCRQLMRECVLAGWATATRKPTLAGLRELENARRVGITSRYADAPCLRSEYYYPQSLRWVRRST
jgi:hypothetical protein